MIELSYRYTAEQVIMANYYHGLHTCRKPFRIASSSIAILAMFGGIFRIFNFGWSFFPIAIFTGGFYWLFLRRYESAWLIRRKFKKLPGSGHTVNISATSEELNLVSGDIASGNVKWSGYLKAVKAPNGFLLYLSDEIFHWIPTNGFKNSQDIQAFTELVNNNVQNVIVLV